MAKITWPPPTSPIDPRKLTLYTLKRGRKLLRIYDPASMYAPGPRTFRSNGPRLRFDHHRGTKVRRHLEPSTDPDRGVYYAAFKLSCAVVEVFGESRVIERGTFEVVESILRDDLVLLDLRGNAAIRAGTLHAIGLIEDRRKTVDGLLHEGAHNGEAVVALYERARAAIDRTGQTIRRLADPIFEIELLKIGDATGFPVI